MRRTSRLNQQYWVFSRILDAARNSLDAQKRELSVIETMPNMAFTIATLKESITKLESLTTYGKRELDRLHMACDALDGSFGMDVVNDILDAVQHIRKLAYGCEPMIVTVLDTETGEPEQTRRLC